MVFMPRRRRFLRLITVAFLAGSVIYLLSTVARLWSIDLHTINAGRNLRNVGNPVVIELARKPRNRVGLDSKANVIPRQGLESKSHFKRINRTWIHHPWTPSFRGHLNVHIWLDWCGSTVNDLRRHIHFPKFPDIRVKTRLFHLVHDAHNYGQRVFGYLHPPRTGFYAFAISSDDSSELWLSSGENPRDVQLIAWVGNLTDSLFGSATSDRQFTKYKSQISAKIFLAKGGRYFVEVLHKQSSSDDHLLVAWKIPRLDKFSYITSGRTSQYVHPHMQRKLDVVQYSHHIPLTPATLKPAIDLQLNIQVEYRTPTKDPGTSNMKLLPKSVAAAIYPNCSYSPSYLIDFNLTRYQGVYLVHETAVYPDDNTDLRHVEKYRPCDEKRDVDSHGQTLNSYIVDEETTLSNDNENWKTNELGTFPAVTSKTMERDNATSISQVKKDDSPVDVRFVNRKILSIFLGNHKEFVRFKDKILDRRKRGNVHSPVHSKTQKNVVGYGISVNKNDSKGGVEDKGDNEDEGDNEVNRDNEDKQGNDDEGDAEDKMSIEDKGGIDNIGGIEDKGGIEGRDGIKNRGGIEGRDGIEGRGGIKDKGGIKNRGGIEGKSSIAIEAYLQNHHKKTNSSQDRDLQPGVNLRVGNESRNVSRASNWSHVIGNTIPLPQSTVSAGSKYDSVSHQDSKAVRQTGRYIARSKRQQQDTRSKGTGNSLKHNKKLDTANLERTGSSRKNRHKRKTRHKQRNGTSKLSNEQVSRDNKKKWRQWQRTGQVGKNGIKALIKNPISIHQLMKSGVWNLIEQYAQEKNLVFTRRTWMYVLWKYFRYHEPTPEKRVEFVYKQNFVKCRLDGNLLLNEDVARSVSLKYFKDLRKGLARDFQLKRVVKVEENHDIYKGDRYLIELDLQVKGQNNTLRLSDYVYLPLGERSFCSPLEFVWQKNRTVHVIVPVKDQGKWVQHFIDDMSELYQQTLDDNLSVIIVDFNSTDIDIENALVRSALKRYQVVKVNGSFQRALGIQIGADAVKNPNDILFTCDLHLEIPNNMIEIIRKHCIQGKMAFSPMVMRLDCGFTPSLPYGEWETVGFGLFAIYKSDFDRIGGMNHEEFKTKWGGEDWEMVDRFLQSHMEIERLRVSEFYHFYHSKNGMWGTYGYEDIVSDYDRTVAEDQFVPAYDPENDQYSQYNYNEPLLPEI